MTTESNNNDNMELQIAHLENATTAKRILDLKISSLKNQIPNLADHDSQEQAIDDAKNKFEASFGSTITRLQSWIRSLRNDDLQTFNRERKEAIIERDRYPQKIEGDVERTVPWTASQRFEYVFLIVGAIILWLVGYFSLVQVILAAKETGDDTGLSVAAAWLLPLAGVTVMALLIKILLSRLQGKKAFGFLLTTFIVSGLIASLAWLFFFSGFIETQTKETAVTTIDQSESVSVEDKSHLEGNFLYIVVSILGETLGAGACWAYAASIATSKTIFSLVDNVRWIEFNGKAEECQRKMRLVENKITTAEGLVDYIRENEEAYTEEVSREHRKLQEKMLSDEERKANGAAG
jgi:hypothetical protein